MVVAVMMASLRLLVAVSMSVHTLCMRLAGLPYEEL